MNVKTASMIDLIRRLEAGQTFTTRDIAERYAINPRTAERWMREIEEFVAVERKTGRATFGEGKRPDTIRAAEQRP